MKKLTIDHSQYKLFIHCPWAWMEKYVNHLERVPERTQRDDALCIGSLVHDGLDNFYRNGNPTIRQETIDEYNPTPEALYMCNLLITQYVAQYKDDPIHKAEMVEAPVVWEATPEFNLLAKVDGYFYVSEYTTIPDGFMGSEITLSPGWWIREHKTKSSRENVDSFMARWNSDMQPAFQMLCMKELLGVYPQGVLINVLEKPNIHTPQRKCKKCGEVQNFSSYQPLGKDEYKCLLCGGIIKLVPLKETQTPMATFYRLPIYRSEDSLRRSLAEILDIGYEMYSMREHGMLSVTPHRPNCVNFFKKKCEYFSLHVTPDGYPIRSSSEFRIADTTKYMGLNED